MNRDLFLEKLNVLIAGKREEIAFFFLEKSTLKYFLKWFLLKLSATHLWITDD